MARQRKLLSLEDDVCETLARQPNASEYVAQLVRSADPAAIVVRPSAAESADIAEAAADAGMSAGDWLRVVACYAAGRPIAEHLERAAEVGTKLFSAALSEIEEPKVRRAARGVRKSKRVT